MATLAPVRTVGGGPLSSVLSMPRLYARILYKERLKERATPMKKKVVFDDYNPVEVNNSDYPEEVREKIINLKPGHKVAWLATDGSEMITIAPIVEDGAISKLEKKKLLINLKKVKDDK